MTPSGVKIGVLPLQTRHGPRRRATHDFSAVINEVVGGGPAPAMTVGTAGTSIFTSAGMTQETGIDATVSPERAARAIMEARLFVTQIAEALGDEEGKTEEPNV